MAGAQLLWTATLYPRERKEGRKAFAANQTTNPLLSLCAGKHGVSDAPATFIAPVAGVRVETFKDVSST